jgi:hypothetical protein
MATRHLELAHKLDAKVRRKVDRIVSSMLKGAEIDDESPKPEGWKDVEYRVAKDARRPANKRPFYLEVASRARETYQRLEAVKKAEPTLNAQVMNVYVDQRVYPTKDVKE